nr:unnamed protein product [Digitaria exilis]
MLAKMGSGVKAYGAVVLIRLMYSGMHVVSKVALDQGMDPLVFVFYRTTTAMLVLIPVTFVLERRKAKPVTFKIVWKMFIHALYGVTASGDLSSLGLNYASATSSSALYNVQPVVTKETLKLTRFHGKVKFVGILFCIAGVTLMSVYKGPLFRSFNHHHLFQSGGVSSSKAAETHSKKQWVLGIFFMTLSNVFGGMWTVLQEPLIEDTSKLMNTTLQVSCASVQAFLVAVAVERDFSKWKLGWNVSLAAIIYSGVIVMALSYYMQMWTIDKRGPVFLAMSMPLTFVILGGVLLVGGLYNVLWGKRIEKQGDLAKISATPGELGLELPPQQSKADLEAPQVRDDDEDKEAKV